jgi:hypothetical protein
MRDMARLAEQPEFSGEVARAAALLLEREIAGVGPVKARPIGPELTSGTLGDDAPTTPINGASRPLPRM